MLQGGQSKKLNFQAEQQDIGVYYQGEETEWEKEEFKGAGVWITTTVTITALTLLGSVLSLS